MQLCYNLIVNKSITRTRGDAALLLQAKNIRIDRIAKETLSKDILCSVGCKFNQWCFCRLACILDTCPVCILKICSGA